MMSTAESGIVYHCFNCGFKTGWNPGWHLSFKMRKLMSWIGVSDSDTKRMVFEALRVREEVGVIEEPEFEELNVEYKPRDFPDNAKPIRQWFNWYAMNDAEDLPADLLAVVTYAVDRGLTDEQVQDMYWTPDSAVKILRVNKRLIVPFTHENKLIGFTGRAVWTADGTVQRYYNQYEPDYVYGLDKQIKDARFVLVVEGPFDAIVVNGVAILGSEVSEIQAELIERLGREVIVIPDKGVAGQKLIDAAQKYGWSVSFPEWMSDQVKDVNDAVTEYGKIFTMKQILEHKETTHLKIELKRKKY